MEPYLVLLGFCEGLACFLTFREWARYTEVIIVVWTLCAVFTLTSLFFPLPFGQWLLLVGGGFVVGFLLLPAVVFMFLAACCRNGEKPGSRACALPLAALADVPWWVWGLFVVGLAIIIVSAVYRGMKNIDDDGSDADGEY